MNDLASSALYLGRIHHRRRGDPKHTFSYRLWHALLDVDHIPEICSRIPMLSHNRFNLLGFHDSDHMGPDANPVRGKLNRWFEEHDVDPPHGTVYLLTGLRHLGYGFNPVSFYFCHQPDGGLQSVVAEVNNTFGETFCYLLDGCGERRVIRQRRAKGFHVSPFQPVAGEYNFRVTAPGERLTVHIDLIRDGATVFDATLTSRREPLTSRSLLSAVVRHAHLSALTVARIHWQALKLWRKGATFHSKPEMPKTAWRTHHG